MSKLNEVCKTFENEREAAIFMLGYNLADSYRDTADSARIDPHEKQTVLLYLEDESYGKYLAWVKTLPEPRVVEQTIVICVAEGVVGEVVSEHPLNYIMADADVEGADLDDLRKAPLALSTITHGTQIHAPRYSHPAVVSVEAVTAIVELHEKVSHQ